jgi:hypothetical protein
MPFGFIPDSAFGFAGISKRRRTYPSGDAAKAFATGVPLRHRRPRRSRGFNFFDEKDENVLPAIARGEFNISGMQSPMLRSLLPRYNSSQISSARSS